MTATTAPPPRTAAQIAASVEHDLHTGALAPGDTLPAVRAAAARLGVNPNTVAAAYRLLRDRGIVETHGRAGTRVRPRPAATPRDALGPPPPPGTVDLASGIPDPLLLPPPLFPDPATWRPTYGHPAVHGPFADAARRVLAADGVTLTDHLAATSGALDGIERVLAAHLRPGDTVAVEDPGWGNLLDLLPALALVPVPVPVDDEGPDPAVCEAALRAGARAVVVTARAQNPTGAAVGAERAQELREVLARHPGTLLVEDDHGNDIAGTPLHTLAGATTHWAHLRSAAKAYGPDLRCAALVGDAVTVGRVAGRQRLGPGWVSLALQHAVAAAWDGAEHRRAAAAAAQAYRERRARLVDALAARGVAANGRTGLNVWVPVPDETRAVAHLLAAGWAVTPGARYRIASPPAVRVSVAVMRDPEAVAPLADAIAAVAAPRAPRGTAYR